jgi:transposase
MEKRMKQAVGIDCGKEELVVSFGIMDENFECKILSTTRFKNNPKQFKKLVEWAKKLSTSETNVIWVVEATGVYHEKVADYLYHQGYQISVILPNKVKAFSKTLKVKTVNDKVSAQTLAYLGLEKKLDAWQPPKGVYKELKQLTRERDQLLVEATQINNQKHAEESGAWPNKQSIKRMEERLRIIERQIKEVEDEIKELLNSDEELKEKVRKLSTIKGVGIMTIAVIIAETDGFNLVRNRKQLSSYAGLDVVEKQSGISIRGKTRISKKGNKYIRKSLYLPALAAIRCNKPMKKMYERLVSKHGIKMKAVVAVMRKLLELSYILWKKNEEFDENYQEKKMQQVKEGTPEVTKEAETKANPNNTDLETKEREIEGERGEVKEIEGVVGENDDLGNKERQPERAALRELAQGRSW